MARSPRQLLRIVAAIGVLPLLVLGQHSETAAAEGTPLVRVYGASEFPELAAGISLPGNQQYTFKVWTPTRDVWSMSVDGRTISLDLKQEGDDLTPRWRTLGSIAVQEPSRIRILTELPEVISEKDQDSSKRSQSNKKTTPKALPSYLVVCSDPELDPSSILALVRGNSETVAPVLDLRRNLVRSNQEGSHFQAPETLKAWQDRAKAVREQLWVALGLWPLPPKTPLHPWVYGRTERDGYTIEKVVLETFPGFTLSGNLYRPAGNSTGRPIILSPHGHWPEGRVSDDLQQRCIRWAKLGCVVFLYDMVGYADSKPFGHQFLNDRLRRWGLSLATLQTWNSIRALDWLSTLPDVDPTKVGCTGESGGGTQTFLLTALDPRVTVAAPVVMVSDTFQGGCVCENCAGLRWGTDNVEFAALAAPRPLKLVGATGDWTKLTLLRAFPAIRDVYSQFGVPDRVEADVFNFPHNYNQTSRNAVYGFMAKWLLGIEDRTRTLEGEQTPEKPEALYTFNKSHPAPWDRMDAARLEAYLVDQRERQLNELAPGADSTHWEAAKAGLLKTLSIRVGLKNPTPDELETLNGRTTRIKNLSVEHFWVGRKGTGERIPVVRWAPEAPNGRATIVASSAGKHGLLNESAQGPSRLVRSLLDRGQTVVGFDPLLVGESFDATAPAFRRPHVVHFETYNPSLAADQIQDLATVVAWTRAQPGVRELSLVGLGEGGAQVLLASPLLQEISRTAVDLAAVDPKDGSLPLPQSLDLPGLLQFGGLKAAAALTSPRSLWIQRPGRDIQQKWPRRAYRLDGSSHLLRITSEKAKSEAIASWIDTGH